MIILEITLFNVPLKIRKSTDLKINFLNLSVSSELETCPLIAFEASDSFM